VLSACAAAVGVLLERVRPDSTCQVVVPSDDASVASTCMGLWDGGSACRLSAACAGGSFFRSCDRAGPQLLCPWQQNCAAQPAAAAAVFLLTTHTQTEQKHTDRGEKTQAVPLDEAHAPGAAIPAGQLRRSTATVPVPQAVVRVAAEVGSSLQLQCAIAGKTDVFSLILRGTVRSASSLRSPSPSPAAVAGSAIPPLL
jgi:hypothetical protein